MINVWVEFAICVFFIVITGVKLCKYGDIIAEKSGLGRVWIGILLIAGATSLPELITTTSSAGLVKAPNMALGVIFGSCIFNLVIIVLLDFLEGPGPLFYNASKRHIQTIMLSIVLLCLTMLAIVTKEPIYFGWIGFTSIVISIVYIIGIKKILRGEKEAESKNISNHAQYGNISWLRAWSGFLLSAVIAIIFSIWISYVGEKIAMVTGIKETFVGNIFLALSTSLPELVVAIAAVRIGAIDMALGNLFGSNAFNIMVLPITDIFYKKGPLLADVNNLHLETGFLGIILSLVAIGGIYFKPKGSIFRLGWDVTIMFSVYLIGCWLLVVRGVF